MKPSDEMRISQVLKCKLMSGLQNENGIELYEGKHKSGATGRSRTCDHMIRSHVLYPTELRLRVLKLIVWNIRLRAN